MFFAKRQRLLPVMLLISGLCIGGDAAAGPDEAWAALERGGMVVIMRHASAPGPEQGREGDPSGFVLEDCATQRNLSDFGREQAARLGDEMRAHHVVFTRVISSPWCRAKDTAAQMNLGPEIEVGLFLANIGEHTAGTGAAETVEMMPSVRAAMARAHEIIRTWSGPGNLMLVSHGRTVSHLLYGPRVPSPQQAAAFVLEPTPNGRGSFREVGSLPPPGGSHN
jgi:broad specificity phosphatase PhoE